jgi:hypothetical protein
MAQGLDKFDRICYTLSVRINEGKRGKKVEGLDKILDICYNTGVRKIKRVLKKSFLKKPGISKKERKIDRLLTKFKHYAILRLGLEKNSLTIY